MGVLSLKSNSNIILLNPLWTYGDGLKFNGVNNYIQVGSASTYGFISQTNIFTLSFVVKTNSLSSFCGMGGNSSSGGQYGIAIYRNAASLLIGITPSLGSYTGNSFFTSTSAITHIVLVGDGTKLSVYKDGQLFGTSSNFTGTNPTAPSSPFAIGSESSGNFNWNGNIYDFKSWTTALTATQINDLYLVQCQTLAGNSAGSLGNYFFNDKQGFVLKDDVGANNGSLINYTVGATSLGGANSWIDKYDNSISIA
jgi:hypothetical protein